MSRQLHRDVLWNLGLLAVYVAAGKLGLSLAQVNPSASAIWPPSGIALAAVLLLGYRVVPAITVGSFIVNYLTCRHINASAIIALGNTLEVALGALLVTRLARGPRFFERAQDIFRFVIYGALLCTAISATLGTTSLALARLARWDHYPAIWLTWWLGDIVGILVLTPLLLTWTKLELPRFPRNRLLEAITLILLLLAASNTIFFGWVPRNVRGYPLEFAAIPLLLWAAFRFRQRGATTVTFILSAIATLGTLRGYGPFAHPDRNVALLLLQGFMGVVAVTALVLAAIISERRRALEALQESERRFRQLAENIREVFYISERPSRRLAYVSPAYQEVWGRPCEELYARPQSFLDSVHPDDRQRLVERIKHQAAGERTDERYRIIRPDGSMRWIWDRAFPLTNEEGEVYRVLGIAEDITALKESEQERERLLIREKEARRQAEQASRAKDEFLAVLSHELRTPLTPVVLTVSLLERHPDLPSDARQDVATIRRNVEMEARLIDDLLDLTRISRGKMKLNLETTDVHEAVRSAMEICCRGGGPQVSVQLVAARHFVRGDSARLQQVFWNLLTNAIKFTPSSGSITVRSEDSVDGSVIVEIADTGIGIEPEILPRLFMAFEQGEAGEARRLGGLGLGLSISRALTESHGGKLSAFSEGKGRGARFTVTLPSVPAPRVEDESDEPDQTGASTARQPV